MTALAALGGAATAVISEEGGAFFLNIKGCLPGREFWMPAGLLRRTVAGYQSRSFTRSRAIDWLCNWHTRDSVTLSTTAISFRFMSCS